MAAPVPASVGAHLAGASAASAAVPVPSGVTAGDIVLVFLYKENNNAVTAPSGFTEIPTAPSTTRPQVHHAFWKRATAADSGTYTFTWTGSVWREAEALRITGAVASGSPIDFSNPAARSSNGTVTPAVAGTTNGPDRLLVWSGSNWTGGSWTYPSGYTGQSGSGTGLGMVQATAAKAAAGATGNVTGTCSASDYETAWLVGIIPGNPAQTVQAGTVPTTDPQPSLSLSQTPTIRPTAIAATDPQPAPQVVPGTVYVQPAATPAPTPLPAPKLVQVVRPGPIAAPPAPPSPTIIAFPRPPLRVDFWALNDDKTILCPLPKPASWDLSMIPGQPGAVRIEYPRDALNFDVLDQRVTRTRDLHIRIRTDGTDRNALGALLFARDGDEVAEGDTVTFTGSFLTVRLREGRIRYNTADPDKKGNTKFAAASAGAILAYFLSAAQSRGTLTDLTWSFTAAADSNGVPWPTNKKVTAAFNPGKTILDVAQQLRTWGLLEFEVTTELEVRAYVPETVGTDHTLEDPPLVLRRGRDLLDAPRRLDVSSAITDLQVAGGEGVYVEVHDNTARAQRGRQIEGYASEGNLTDTGSATTYAQTALARDVVATEELDYTLTFAQDLPAPLRELKPSDWAYSDTGSGLGTRERVAQITVSQKAGQDRLSGGVVLRDLLAERDILLQRQLDALTDGSAVIGTSTSSAPDTVAPAAPTGVVVDSSAYQQGIDTYATLITSWSAVTTNADGSAATDVAGYRVQWRLAATSGVWTLGADTTATSARFGGVAAGADVLVRVAAYDRNNNVSAWSAEVPITTANDTGAPPVPSTPTVSNYLGVLLVGWDGLGAAGEVMPDDFDYVEIHMSASASFAPTAATYVDRLYGKGTFPVADLPYTTTQYFRLIAVDRTTPDPNKSDPSGTGSGAPEKVVGSDVFAGAVGSAQLADLAVITAKMDNLAVNDAKFGSGSVGKLTAGTFSAALTLSGIFRTGTSGARGEWDSTSFRQYNASGVQTIGLVPGGVSFITGEFRTALSGQRLVLNPGGSAADTIRVFPSGSGDYAEINAVTAPSDGSAAIVIDGGAASTAGRGRFAAYKGEAAVSYASGSDGFSRTALSCNSDGMVVWTPGQDVANDIRFFRTNGSNINAVLSTELRFTIASGAPVIGAPAQGVGLLFTSNSGGYLIATAGFGTDFRAMKATVFTQSSSQYVKEDITPIRKVMTPLDVIEQAQAKAWRYIAEVERLGDEAPVHLGPVAEELPPELVFMSPKADGSDDLEPSVSLGSQIGVLWGAVNQLLARRITSTTATCVVPAGTILGAGATKEVPCTWESSPLALPTDALVFLNAGLLGAGKVTAWVKTGSVTGTGCIVVFKNTSSSTVVAAAAALAGLTSITATVIGQALYTPPIAA